MSRPQGPVDPTKVVFRRVIAYLIDMVIALGAAAAVFFATANLTQIEGATDCARYELASQGCLYAEINGQSNVFLFENRAALFAWLVGAAYSVLFIWLLQGLVGWTPGKLCTGIRVVNEQGRGPGIGRSLIRWLLMIIDDLCAGLVGLIVMLVSKGHRRVGDMAAKTFVVKTQYRGAPIVVPGMTVAVTAPQPTVPDYAMQMPTSPPVAPAPAEMPTPPAGTPVADSPPTQAQPSVAGGPRWDPARNAYIQWDEARGAWLAYDDSAKEWKPLS